MVCFRLFYLWAFIQRLLWRTTLYVVEQDVNNQIFVIEYAIVTISDYNHIWMDYYNRKKCVNFH